MSQTLAALGAVALAALSPQPTPALQATPVPRATPAPQPTASAALPLSAVKPGDVVVSEFMKDPTAVSDAAGEWIEVTNLLAWRVDVEGMEVRGTGSESFVLDAGGAGIVLAPGARFVLGANADPAQNGGVAVDYEYSGFSLKNSADAIVLLSPQGLELDAVRYDDGVLWPDTPGFSISLDDSGMDPIANDDPSNWCHATTVMGSGDSGTPGAPNDDCP